MSVFAFLVVATVAGWLVDRMAPNRIPYGVGASAAAALGISVLIALPLGDQGPHLFEVAVIPAAAGALAGAVALRLVLSRSMRSSP